jgi:hypothetical protein
MNKQQQINAGALLAQFGRVIEAVQELVKAQDRTAG